MAAQILSRLGVALARTRPDERKRLDTKSRPGPSDRGRYREPNPVSTVRTVRIRISRSSQGEKFLM